jgi:hypothetical protein
MTFLSALAKISAACPAFFCPRNVPACLDKASVIDASVHVEICQNKLLTMKADAGLSLQKFLDGFDADGCYKGAEVMQNASDIEKLSSVRAQFFQALHDNLGKDFHLKAVCCSSS